MGALDQLSPRKLYWLGKHVRDEVVDVEVDAFVGEIEIEVAAFVEEIEATAFIGEYEAVGMGGAVGSVAPKPKICLISGNKTGTIIARIPRKIIEILYKVFFVNIIPQFSKVYRKV